jgi:hypothetical protein
MVDVEAESWREREARNEAGLRDQNEWIGATSESFGAHDPTDTFVCECGDPECEQTIELSTVEYAAVRASPTRFAVVPNHENPESEVVISEGARFSVVDTVHGPGLEIARATDPRSAEGPKVKP